MLTFAQKTRDVVPLLVTQLATEDLDVVTARTKYDELALAAADGSASQKDADRAHDNLTAITQRRERTARTLQAAQARAVTVAAEQARKDRDAILSKCIKLTEERADAADAVQAAVQNLADKVRLFLTSQVALEVGLPSDFSMSKRDQLQIDFEAIKAGVRNEFDRRQPYGGPLPYFEHPPFAQPYRHAVDAMRRMRAEELGTTHD